ncbi:glycosyltransferase [Sunxiuqinia sp. A32]|uniref:glycosyltransferase n=1 Tax=Sunxiuqinia sp. A32 TaxID=3461496 RepID=UPI00404574FF
MKILMFGWEFPPNISGGLGTACYGITKSLSSYDDVDITFVVPKAHGNELTSKNKILGANQIDLIKSKINQEKLQFPKHYLNVESGLVPYANPELFEETVIKSVEEIGKSTTHTKRKSIGFSGKYGANLFSEVHNFSIIAEYIAEQSEYDVIHAHDWLTFPAGIAAKKKTKKPLVVHVHATDFDRSGGKVNPKVFEIEKNGMAEADCIITVSEHTRQIVINHYHIPPTKIHTVHNGVEPFTDSQNHLTKKANNEKLVTYLGRITLQKGPEFFVEVAKLVLKKMTSVRFVMAGSGDLMHDIISQVAKAGIADHFHFTGFLKGDEVCKLLKQSDIYIMPSVSEPFGISPLEAMQLNIPTIISKQSGVSELVTHVIKTDFWDTEAMADAIYGILTRPALKKMISVKGKTEVNNIKWSNSAAKIHDIYKHLSA